MLLKELKIHLIKILAMEDNNNIQNTSNSRIWSGLILVLVGLIFFLENSGINIPDWIISWHTGLIIIGLFVGFKRNFQGVAWLVMILIGGYFTLEEIARVDFSKYYFAVALMILGLWLILKPKSNFKNRDRWKQKFTHTEPSLVSPVVNDSSTVDPLIDGSDILDSVNVFGGSHQTVYSKNFKGGEIVAVFGGCDVNLTQADFNGTIILEIVAVFGGAKIIVPAGWQVKSEITAVFGGLDDKRAIAPPTGTEERKLLIIRGLALFGGVDIRNF